MATVKLTELFRQNRFTSSDNRFNMRPVYVNPDFVVCLREDLQTLKMLQEGNSSLPEGLDSRHEFTKLHINSGNSSFDITVVGFPVTIAEANFHTHSFVSKSIQSFAILLVKYFWMRKAFLLPCLANRRL